MHLLRIDQSGDLYQDGEAVDLGLSPARFVILSAADTDLMLLASAVDQSGRGDDAVRLANILTLSHPYSIDLLVDQTLRASRLMVVRLLGGISYWSYGVERLAALARQEGIDLALLPGDGKPDPELERLSTLDPGRLNTLNAYLVAGGMDNARAFLDCLDDIADGTGDALPPKPLLQAGLYWPGEAVPDLVRLNAIWSRQGLDDAPVAALVFYRALAQSGDTLSLIHI